MGKKLLKLPYIECSGTPYEIGKTYGEAAKKNIHFTLEKLLAKLNAMKPTDRETIRENARKYQPYLEEFDSEQIEIIKGRADGAGVDYLDILSLKCWFEFDLYPSVTELCTSFAVTGSATKDGKTLLGMNLDVEPWATLDVVRTTFNDGMKQLSLVFSGSAELTLNSAGLGNNLNFVVFPAKEQRLCVPALCVMSKALRQLRVDKALGILCIHNRSTLHNMVGNGEGEIFSVECRPDDFNIIQPKRDYLVHANHYLTERFRAQYKEYPPVQYGTYVRQQRLERLIEHNYGTITEEKMMEFLSDHHNYPRSICCHPEPELQAETVAAVVMNLTDKILYVSNGTPCVNEFQEFRL